MPTACQAGASSSQRSKAAGQRSAKRQPGKCRSGCGTLPTGASSAPPRLAASGSAAKSLREYGCSGVAKKAARGPVSTTWPAYITPTRWATRATTPRSWVISSIAMPSRRCSAASRSSTWAWMVTSSAVVGSSAISRRGRPASAIAIITRCFIPPENWKGNSCSRRSGSGMPTAASRRHASARAASPRRPWAASASAICAPTLITGLRLVDGSWKIMPMRPPRTRRIAASGSASRSSPPRRTLPAAMRPPSGSRRASASAVIDLPQPDSPRSAKVSPAAMAKSTPSTGRMSSPSLRAIATPRPSTCSSAAVAASGRSAGNGAFMRGRRPSRGRSKSRRRDADGLRSAPRRHLDRPHVERAACAAPS